MNSQNSNRPGSARPAGRPSIGAGLLVGVLIGISGMLAFRPAPANATLNMMDVGTSGDITALTTDGGSDDVLMLIDQRAEQLLVYHVRAQNDLQFVQRYALRELFTNGRLQFGSKPVSPAPASTPGGR